MLIFSILSVWDAFTSVIGTSHFLKLKNDIIPSVIPAIMIIAFMTCTRYIWQQANGSLRIVLGFLWVIAFFYDVFTSYFGNLLYILNGSAQGEQTLFLWGITFLTSVSPVLISVLLSDE